MAPSGLMFSEITASAILKVDDKGAVVEQGSTNLGISKSVFDLHEVIHSARKDAKCVMFVAADSVKVVSITFCSKVTLVNLDFDISSVCFKWETYH